MQDCEERQRIHKKIAIIAEAIRNVYKRAAAEYTVLVGDVEAGRITDESSIEQILDGLLGFCDSEECFELFKRLCRHVLPKYPEMVKDYIDLYRELFDEQAEGGE